MNLNSKGWLADYLILKEREFNDGKLTGKFKKGAHPEQTLYGLIQPTGIMYGYPLKNLNAHIPNNEEEKVKLLLIDTLLSTYILFRNQGNIDSISFDEVLVEAVDTIGSFYNAVYPELYTNSKGLFGQKRAPENVVERIINKRIKVNKDSTFWSNFFHYSLLFLDIYFFKQWIHTNKDQMIVTYLRSQRDDIRLSVINVMTAAAHANHTVEAEERKLFEHYISASSLPSDKKRAAREFFEKGFSVNELEIPGEESWILKKYLLELAILTTWADRKIEKAELDFLQYFNSRLGFEQDDYEKSLIAVEGFVLNYWEELDKLQSRRDFEFVSHQYIERLERIVRQNKDRLYKEIMDRGTLLKLIAKARTGEVSLAEQETLKNQLIDAFETLPAFEVISLPRKFLTLKVLMSILPPDFFRNF